jgi:hypothetical protein
VKAISLLGILSFRQIQCGCPKFTDFLGSMKSILSCLNPGGILYAGVPNIDNFGIGQFQNAHVYYFSPRTFKYYMAMSGLKLIDFGPAQRIHMYGIFQPWSDRIDTDIKSLDKECKIMVKKIRMSKIKHFLGRILEAIGVKKTVESLFHKC